MIHGDSRPFIFIKTTISPYKIVVWSVSLKNVFSFIKSLITIYSLLIHGDSRPFIFIKTTISPYKIVVWSVSLKNAFSSIKSLLWGFLRKKINFLSFLFNHSTFLFLRNGSFPIHQIVY